MQDDMAILYKHVKALDMLYRHAMLGDSFVDLAKQDSNTHKQKITLATQANQQYNSYEATTSNHTAKHATNHTKSYTMQSLLSL